MLTSVRRVIRVTARHDTDTVVPGWEDLLSGEDPTLEELQRSGFIESVQEPGYSRGKLIRLQRQYGVHSEAVYRGEVDLSGILPADLDEWFWAMDMHITAGGALSNLPFEDEPYDFDERQAADNPSVNQNG